MAQSLIACPLCSAASFSSTNSLCLSLVNVASKWLRCTLCEEELRGMDKLTIHLLSHLIHTSEFKRHLCVNNSYVVEPLNVVKSQNDQLRDNSNIDQEMVLDKNISVMIQPKGITEDTSERFSLKIDDEVMIFFNSNETEGQTSIEANDINRKCGVMVNATDKLNNTVSGISNLNFTTNVTNSEQSQPEHMVLTNDQQSHTTSTMPNFLITPDQTPSNNSITHSIESKVDLSLINMEKEYRSLEDTIHVDKSLSEQFNHFSRGENNKNSFLSPNGEQVVGYRCDVCSLVFPDENILSMHRQLIHVELSDDSSKTMSYKCHLCSKSFLMKGSLMVHMRVAHFGGAVVARLVEAKQLETNAVSPESAQFVCSICNKGFRKEQQLAQHEKLHDGKQCDICMKTFTTKYFLRKHKRLHTGEMPYTCHMCNKSFTFQQSYHKHLLYHSDEKPHTCADCGRAFKELSTLHNHQRIHTGEKPFSCDTCGKCFRQRVSYLVHRRIHTGVMPYRCQDCGKTFRYKVSERTHKCSASVTGGSLVSAELPATGTTQVMSPEFQNKKLELQAVNDYMSGNMEKQWDSKDIESFPPQMDVGNGSFPEPTDFFSLVMSPSDRLQHLSLSSDKQADCHRQDNIDTESLKQLLYDVADYNN